MPATLSALKGCDFDFAPLLAQSVATEGEVQDDHEDTDEASDDPLNEVDDEYPLLPPPDPWNDVDEEYPPPPPPDPWNDIDDLPLPPRKRPRTTFHDVTDSGNKPLKGPHRRRKAKRAQKLAEHGHIPAAKTLRKIVAPTPRLPIDFNAAVLPTAFGAYAAKVEDKAERYGSKKRRTLKELLGLGFHLVEWNGLYVRA
jgi:hypothetical protein